MYCEKNMQIYDRALTNGNFNVQYTVALTKTSD